MSALPPRQRLGHLLRSLTKHLPGQLEGLLENTRFKDGAAALQRLTDPAHVEKALARMSPEEAGWLADLLTERWSWVAGVQLEPEVAIVAPDELWIGAEPIRVPLSLAAVGLDEGFEAVWEGAVLPSPPAPSATLLARPPEGKSPGFARVRAQVRASVKGQRCVLIAQAQVALRRPSVVVSEDRRRLLAQDHAGRPAVGCRLEIGPDVHLTGAGGLVELEVPAPSGVALKLEGIPAGRIPGGNP
ncbi:hypothetical protein EJ065_3145 [Corallococcus coralloides]|uniref:Uncharacterized protein n=1 Tax=Corallococcus coralloides TaxID=184914 RepID=A0A410RS59_CORCK|nr:hypothetical protein [Corallococcus coralloides]QAT84712.1 hypothetical protein EJ065_3145 [Corallococcus coralloides]